MSEKISLDSSDVLVLLWAKTAKIYLPLPLN